MTEADDVLFCEARSKVARCSGETTALSFVEVVLAIFVRGSDSNAATRQCLPKKYLDFGIDAPQVRHSASLYCIENGFLRPEREGDAVRSGRPTSLCHNRLGIQGASIDHGGDFPVANQDNEQIRDHGGLTFRIEGVSEFFLVELAKSVFYDAHGAFHDHTSGGPPACEA